MHSKMELPVRSTTRYPACSMSSATAARWPTFIRMPQRLCCPSRRVWSMRSISATVHPPPFSGSADERGAIEDDPFEPRGVDGVGTVVRVVDDPAKDADGRVDTFDHEGTERADHAVHCLRPIGAGDDELGDH